jgi:hypothetical protein
MQVVITEETCLNKSTLELRVTGNTDELHVLLSTYYFLGFLNLNPEIASQQRVLNLVPSCLPTA